MLRDVRFAFALLVLASLACNSKMRDTGTINAGYNFDFAGAANKGFTAVKPSDFYRDEKGYGFEKSVEVIAINRGKNNAFEDGFITTDKPFFFSIKLAEGNYNVTVTLGDAEGASDVAIRAECRRMMVNRIKTSNGEVKQVEFTVHVRDSLIKGTNEKVKLKPRERDYRHWDNKLTLEFNGEAPKVSAVAITPASEKVVTVFLAGNSTVVDQAAEPYASWGQMIPAYFEPGKVAIANYAESGEALSSFIAARRFEKILSLMKPGDYAFVEFGHNDQKQKGPGIGAYTSYKKDLLYFISEVKKKGGIPVLVTSVQRRSFDSSGHIMETLGDYPDAVRTTAVQENVPLIDLNAMTKTMYEAWGPAASIKAFVHFPANTFPGQPNALADNTHFTPFGANEIAKLVIKGIRKNVPGLAKYIVPETPVFNPAKPDEFTSFYWPYSLQANAAKPDGN